MAQQVNARTAPTEDPSSVPRTHIMQPTMPITPGPCGPVILSDPQEHQHTWHTVTQTYT